MVVLLFRNTFCVHVTVENLATGCSEEWRPPRKAAATQARSDRAFRAGIELAAGAILADRLVYKRIQFGAR